jgi:hypothetical protein
MFHLIRFGRLMYIVFGDMYLLCTVGVSEFYYLFTVKEN